MLPVALYRSAPDGELMAGNRALADLLGFERMEDLHDYAKYVDSLYVDPPERKRWLDEINEHGTVRDFDVELRRRDGRTIWVRDTARVVRDQLGNVTHYEGCIFDVTDRIRLEQSRDQFIATISHELRNPIAVLYGLGRELSDSYESFDENERVEMLKIMAGESEEATWLIEDLLVAHRDDISNLPIHSETFQVGPEISRVVDVLEEPVIVSGETESWAQGDTLRTRQIVRNLVTNAQRYGGGDVSVVVATGGGWVRIQVCDSGKPIDPATLQRIFEPFGRSSDSSHSGSVGLGLWISTRLAELMGGGIEYVHDGRTSCFELTLPGQSRPSA